jgi:hypothetical protein
MSPRRGSKPRRTDRLVVGRNVTLTLLYSALYGVYTEVLRDLTAALKESAAKGETAKITTTESPSNEEFPEQRRRKRTPPDDSDKKCQEASTIHHGSKRPQITVEG